ncbi:uncharacterized protein LOC106168264 [Lingula anatina]|uniref:Uncharacterized protein LOC106168264 n=1 Tax=Lingula anatina TaxID=7574 RepID=A0A1S3IWZ9_LINAN|nr:uncharacterized protein LOC106168264 [Lingula anatina]XP_013402726.1 uncharacterized protein LOC106168264 [Lingula anatina]|eukprot:XP_013402725.1 uncharacterized protein LOC106168264 [Lingula anatina]
MWNTLHKYRSNLILCIRISCFLGFLGTSLVISWSSLTAFVALLVSLYALNDAEDKRDAIPKLNRNPLKGKPQISVDDLPRKVIDLMEHKVTELVTYDAEDVDSLANFETLKMNTECIFAKKARLWGSPKWNYDLSIEHNIYQSVPTFLKFTCLCEPLGLDGFVYELPGDYGKDVQTFGQAVRRVLTTISDHDPSGVHCMKQSFIAKRGWVFQFNKITFFVTTFAPCYPDNHSRYAFDSDHAYILLQPEISFAQHDLPSDTPVTNWGNPKTVRDRIRVAFRDAGREYKIRDTIYFPTVLEIVKPIESNGPDVKWWISDKKND